MSLRVAVAAPFKDAGERRLPESRFVVALSMDRDWLSPDQAKRLVDVARGEGLLEADDDALRITFDPDAVTVPEGFSPDESLFQEQSPFERVLDALVSDGHEKRTAVGEINQLQDDLGLTVDAAAVLYARRRGLDVEDAASTAATELRDG